MTTAIGIIGDFNSGYPTHIATNDAIEHSLAALHSPVQYQWIGTDELAQAGGLKKLTEFTGLWIGPGSPYKSMAGALSAIQWARELEIPLLGTCGGFQHIILEHARNVLGFADAEHEEIAPHAARLFISRLTCSLVGRSMTITLQPDSLVARSYSQTRIQEQYRCNFGVNPEYENVLRSSALRIVGSDDEGVVRVVELADHPFFVGTLFVPQLTSAPGAPHPLVLAFVKTCAYDRGASALSI